jgi:hypothetical protein
MLACCGLIEINLIVSNSTSTVAWTLYFVIIIGVFLGIAGYKIGNNPLEKPNVSLGILLIILIVNILYIGFVSQLPILEMLEVLTFSLLLPMWCFEESTRFLLFDLRQKPATEVIVS